jgi:hypothetical protein
MSTVMLWPELRDRDAKPDMRALAPELAGICFYRPCHLINNGQSINGSISVTQTLPRHMHTFNSEGQLAFRGD